MSKYTIRKECFSMNRKVVKGFLAMGMSVSLLVSGVAAGNYASAAKKLSVSTKKVTLYVGKKKTVKTNMSAKFSVSNKKIVSLKNVKKKQCTVVAKKKGTCMITVKAKKQVKKIKVTVKKVTPVKTKAPTITPTVEPTAVPTMTPVTTISPTASSTIVPTTEPVQLALDLSMEDRVNYFGFQMFNQLNEDSNVMISPYSIMMAMTMLDNAADGETKAELEKVLGIADLDKWNEEFSTYFKTYLNQDDTNQDSEEQKLVLRTTNSIWKNDTYYSFDSEVQTKYLNLMKDLYGAEGLSMDFAKSNPKDQINSWVEEKTEGMIKNLIQEPIEKDVENVLVNALYFSGKWQTEFEQNATKENAEFFGKTGTTKVDMMRNSCGNYKYVEKDMLAVAEFPFQDGDMVMDVVLAKEDASTIEEFNKLSNKEKTALFLEVSGSEEEKLNVSLPKFKMTYGTKDIKNQLQQMGITSVFTEEVQLPGLKGDNLENICVSDVLHQTIIEVAERGVKAGAATGIIFKPIAPSKVTEFNVNKPFVYVIRDTKTNMIYFVGQIEDLTDENRM